MVRLNRGQSPVVAVVLLVALVVIASAAVYTTASGIASSLSEPKVTEIEVVKNGQAGDVESSASVRFNAGSGDAIDSSELRVQIDGEPASQHPANVEYPEQEFGTGDSIAVHQSLGTDLTGGEEITLIRDTGNDAYILREATVERGGLSAQSPYFSFSAYRDGEDPDTPWTATTNVRGGGNAEVEVRKGAASVGDRALYLDAYPGGHGTHSGSGTAVVTIDVDLSDVSTFSFDYYNVESYSEFKITINGSQQSPSISNGQSSWHEATMDVSNHTGTQTIRISISSNRIRSSVSARIDNLQFRHSDGSLVPEEELLPN